MSSPATVVPMGFVSHEDSHRAIREIIERQHQATPDEMGRGREALVNGIEACQRAVVIRQEMGLEEPYQPEVYLGAHPTYPGLFCIADNGCGMTYESAERHLASIGCSGNAIARDQDQNNIYSLDSNKGVGVKISLLPDNPGGLEYVSATINPDGTEVCWFKLGYGQNRMPGFLLLDEQDGFNGNERVTSVNLDWEEQQSDTLNFPHIKAAGHGTVLTLFGDDRTGQTNTTDLGDTFRIRYAQPIKQKENDLSLLRWINCRFWDFNDVKVIVDVGNEKCSAKGASHFLNRSRFNGTVQLAMPDQTPVDVHWWVMPQRQGSDLGATSNNWSRMGHTAIKYKGELYWDPKDTAKARKKHLRNFGIYSGYSQVVIYVDFDSLPTKKQQKLIATNESRTKLFYNRQLVDLATDDLGEQFFELINSKDPSVRPLIEFMDGELPPEDNSDKSDEELKRLFRSLGLFTPIERSIKQSQEGKPIGAGETEDREIIPTHKTDKPITRKRAVAPTVPKGQSSNGIEKWDNDLPRFCWSDDVNPDQSVSYSRSQVEVYTQCKRFQFLLQATLQRVQKNTEDIPLGVIRQVTEKHLKEAVKEQILSYIYVTAGYAKSQKTSFQVIQRDTCNEEILESQLMLNASVQDRLTKSIQRALINGK